VRWRPTRRNSLTNTPPDAGGRSPIGIIIESMKLWIASDLHLDQRKDFVPGARRPADFDVLIVAGDTADGNVRRGVAVAAAMAGGKPAIYVAGNHCHWGESFESVLEDGLAEAAGTSVHFLQNATADIDGVRFFGATLWEPTIRDPRAARPNLSAIMSGLEAHPQPHSALIFGEPVHLRGPGIMDRRAKNRDIQRQYENSRAALANSGADVVSTHYPPTKELLQDVEGAVSLWVHGHEHRVRDEIVAGTHVVCNAIGTPAERRKLDNLCTMVVDIAPRPIPGPG
jgi:predicted phosphodiesterase